MNTPPLLMAAALFFWGWQTGHLLWGGVLGALLEASRVSRRRWEFSDAALKRVWFLGLALLFGVAFVLFSTEDRMLFVFKFAQALPVCLLPLMLAQAYGNRPAIPLTVFSWPLTGHTELGAANISYVYFALCIIGTSATTQPDACFYPGIALLILAALTATRPRRVGLLGWMGLAAAVVVGGYFSQQELRRAQTALEGALGGFIADMFHQAPDARECRTSIGRAGEIPHSGRIIWRLTPDDSGFVPSLLCQAVYDGYRSETWTCSSNDFVPAARRRSETFALLPKKSIEFAVRIAGYYEDGAGPVALPHGVFELTDVASPGTVLTNRLGCAQLNNAPGLVECAAHWGPGPSLDPPPGILDTNVPENERAVLAQIAAKLGLARMSDRQKIRAVERFFGDGFRYTLRGNPRKESGKTPLGIFLTETRVGHCEYYATATVLLLRQAGIPARYATGYAVPEGARQGKMILIRERHAHAWALVYHSDTGNWEEIDTTPAIWATIPTVAPPWWEPVSDFGSNLYFRFSEWRWSKTSLARYASWLMAPLILYLVWRIIADQRGRVAARAREDEAADDWPGLDSELYQIDRQLAAAQLSRRPGETLAFWQRRLESAEALPGPDRLKRIFNLHRALRFDPHGLSHAQRRALQEEAEIWLMEFAAQNPKAKTSRLFVNRTS